MPVRGWDSIIWMVQLGLSARIGPVAGCRSLPTGFEPGATLQAGEGGAHAQGRGEALAPR